MGTTLPALKDELHSAARAQVFKDVLAPYRLPVEAWRAGLLNVFETDSYLTGNCDLQSVLNSAMTIAVLGLRMDKATGQSCVVPFAGKAQPIVMVQGYTVIAGRGGYTLQSRLIREGDTYEEVGGSNPGIAHKPKAGNSGKAIATYAVARSQHHPTLFSPIMYLDEIIGVRDRSKGYQAAMRNNKKHPWSTDFEAMMLKTPKRRLAKDIPNDQLACANWLDTQHDMGNLAWLRQDGQGVTEQPPDDILPPRAGNVTDILEEAQPKAALQWIQPSGQVMKADTIEQWSTVLGTGLAAIADVEKLRAAFDRNKEGLAAIMREHPDHAAAIYKIFNDKGIS